MSSNLSRTKKFLAFAAAAIPFAVGGPSASAASYWFDNNGNLPGHGVAGSATYDWLSGTPWATDASGNFAGGGIAWPGGTNQAYFIGAGAGTTYTVQTGTGGSSSVTVQNIGINIDATGTGSLGLGNVAIGNPGDAGTLTLAGSNSVAAQGDSTLTINTAYALGAFTTSLRGGNVVLNGVVSGTGSVNLAAGFGLTSGVVRLASTANTYTGRTIIGAGFTLEATKFASSGTAHSLGNANSTASNIQIAGTLKFVGTGGQNSNRGMQFNGAGGTLEAAGATTSDMINFNTVAGGITFDATAGNKVITLAGTNAGINNTLGGVVGDAGAGSLTSITKIGSGRWNLTGANTYTGTTTLSGGVLNAGTTGNLGSPSATLAFDGGTLLFNATTLAPSVTSMGHPVVFNPGKSVGLDVSAGSFTVDQVLNQGSGGFNKGGVGTVILNSAHTFTGNVSIGAGRLVLSNSAAVGVGPKFIFMQGGSRVLELSGGITLGTDIGLILSSNSNDGGGVVGSNGTNEIKGSILQTTGSGALNLSSVAGGTLVVSGNLNTWTTGRTLYLGGPATTVNTFSGAIGQSADTLPIIKQGAGTWVLSNANIHTGTTTINGGTLQTGNSAALGFGGPQTTVTRGTNVNVNTALDLAGTTNVNEPIVLNGGLLANSSATPASIGNGVAGITYGTLSGSAGPLPTITISGTGTGATAKVSGALTANSFTIVGGTTVYSAAPLVTITDDQGLVAGSAAAVLSNGTFGTVTGINITIPGFGFTSAPNIAFTGGTVTSPGIDPTGVGNDANFLPAAVRMVTAGTGYTGTPTYTIDGGTGTFVPGALTLSSVTLAADSSIGGTGTITIDAIVSESGGSRNLTKVGTGQLMLNGANTYTGSTIVQSGSVKLGLAAHSAVISTGAGADIQNGKVIFDYTGGSSVAGTISSLLTTSFASGFTNPASKLRSSTATASRGLGWSDDGVSAVTVMATYYGDANLDGQVSSTDFSAFVAGYGQITGGVWAQGDFDYNGKINTLDFNVLAANFGAPALSSLPSSSLGVTVPEPAAAMSCFALAAAGLLGRRRRLAAR